MIDIDHLKTWIGRTEEAADVATASPVERLAALLDHEAPPWPPNALPPLAHWLYFLPNARQSEIGEDGHPKRGGFLPPVPLPRRMWAGSRLEFRTPIAIGAPMTKRSTVQSTEAKSGASGEMVFVVVRHEIALENAPAIVEEQDLVYREAPKPNASQTGKAALHEGRTSEWTRTVTPDPVQLFRYSALTFNGHRIHYDRDYARDIEGYPGLVVHGPYTASLLVDHFLRHRRGAAIAKIAFRAVRPLFDTAPFELCGSLTDTGADLWAQSASGETAMTMSVALSETHPNKS
ncbi:MAG TPA: MaoC family dehydratase N-terminal domain-containing protein [Rhizomicrobium sp.]|nr:MaoC family dehydratase N-terminal domain-containing protein [Rhizomicrobium sp.]